MSSPDTKRVSPLVANRNSFGSVSAKICFGFDVSDFSIFEDSAETLKMAKIVYFGSGKILA